MSDHNVIWSLRFVGMFYRLCFAHFSRAHSAFPGNFSSASGWCRHPTNSWLLVSLGLSCSGGCFPMPTCKVQVCHCLLVKLVFFLSWYTAHFLSLANIQGRLSVMLDCGRVEDHFQPVILKNHWGASFMVFTANTCQSCDVPSIYL